MKEPTFEQLVELIAHNKYVWNTTESHDEVMKALQKERRLTAKAFKCGYDMRELRDKVHTRYLDLVYAKN